MKDKWYTIDVTNMLMKSRLIKGVWEKRVWIIHITMQEFVEIWIFVFMLKQEKFQFSQTFCMAIWIVQTCFLIKEAVNIRNPIYVCTSCYLTQSQIFLFLLFVYFISVHCVLCISFEKTSWNYRSVRIQMWLKIGSAPNILIKYYSIFQMARCDVLIRAASDKQ